MPKPNPPEGASPIPLRNCHRLILPDTSPRPITDPEGGPPRFTADGPKGPLSFLRELPSIGQTFTYQGTTYRRIS